MLNQAENIPVVLPSSSIKIWGTSVKNCLYDGTKKEKETTNIYRFSEKFIKIRESLPFLYINLK